MSLVSAFLHLLFESSKPTALIAKISFSFDTCERHSKNSKRNACYVYVHVLFATSLHFSIKFFSIFFPGIPIISIRISPKRCILFPSQLTHGMRTAYIFAMKHRHKICNFCFIPFSSEGSTGTRRREKKNTKQH